MDEGVTGGTNGNQPLLFMNSRPPVMHRALVPCPTALAPVPIAQENQVADAGKVPGGVQALPVAGGAESGNRWVAAAIGTEERFLAEISHG